MFNFSVTLFRKYADESSIYRTFSTFSCNIRVICSINGNRVTLTK